MQNPEEFRDHCGKEYLPDEVDCTGWTSIKVLSFLIGKKWDIIALAYAHALKPSYIRVTEGMETLDARVGRVTVLVNEDNTILEIEQEVEVALPEGVEGGDALDDALRHGLDSEQVKWYELDGTCVMNGITGEYYKMVDGKKIPYPKSKK